ncbi:MULTISPECIES: gamma-mobile-trio recombinase GmtY [Pseudomonas putida group]|uniref:Recombinase n=1 Tax=Pseudomonas monteilii SB3101 TaxID=1435058 RepID=V9UX40_9PSED|nr:MULTISPECIES: gamma-mobile-trio recombinase GmtY [Pseudomonas putida group]AHC81807.1 recombinase [Pseudomonas monteilii SB3078]AHC87236.1 recombinase [Pseudomonas monteilii SB3101]
MNAVVKVKVDYRGPTNVKTIRLPAVLTDKGILISLLQYQSEQHRSQSWHQKVNLVVRLLLTFVDHGGIPFTSPTDLLKGFRHALYYGTVDERLEDPTGLYWGPRTTETADDLINLLTGYTDWLTRQPGHSGVLMNPIRDASGYEERLNWCAYHHRQDNKLLNHLTSDAQAEANFFTREVGRQQSSVIVDEVKRFPEKHFHRLLDEGFVIAGKQDEEKNLRTDWKSQCITILMNSGGIRKSEAFHIYLDDIDIDEDLMEAVVTIHHPSDGKVKNDNYANRREYLLKKFRLKPRTDYLKSESQHAGWKAPAINNQRYFEVQFFPPSKAQEFLLAFRNYVLYQRVEPKGLGHPYAFTNSNGEPETIKNFQRLHRAAVERIGLKSAKYHGTTEHGHRHAYGYRLAEAGFSAVEIKKAMHHKCVTSCQVYIQPTNSDLRKKMRQVEAAHKATLPNSDAPQSP